MTAKRATMLPPVAPHCGVGLKDTVVLVVPATVKVVATPPVVYPLALEISVVTPAYVVDVALMLLVDRNNAVLNVPPAQLNVPLSMLDLVVFVGVHRPA